MIIKAVKFRRDGFYTQPFVFGGEEGAEKFDKNIRYRGSLQNYLIDTGDEVILVDTGLPAGTPEEVPNEKSPAYTGRDVGTSLYKSDLYKHRVNGVIEPSFPVDVNGKVAAHRLIDANDGGNLVFKT